MRERRLRKVKYFALNYLVSTEWSQTLRINNMMKISCSDFSSWLWMLWIFVKKVGRQRVSEEQNLCSQMLAYYGGWLARWVVDPCDNQGRVQEELWLLLGPKFEPAGEKLAAQLCLFVCHFAYLFACPCFIWSFYHWRTVVVLIWIAL